MTRYQVYLDCHCVRWTSKKRWLFGEQFYCSRHRRVSVVIIMIEPQHRYQTVTSPISADADAVLF